MDHKEASEILGEFANHLRNVADTISRAATGMESSIRLLSTLLSEQKYGGATYTAYMSRDKFAHVKRMIDSVVQNDETI